MLIAFTLQPELSATEVTSITEEVFGPDEGRHGLHLELPEETDLLVRFKIPPEACPPIATTVLAFVLHAGYGA